MNVVDCEATDTEKVPIWEQHAEVSEWHCSRHKWCCSSKTGISAEQLADGLKALGYELAQSELGVLMHTISLSKQGEVAKPAFLASQVDWQDFQQNFK